MNEVDAAIGAVYRKDYNYLSSYLNAENASAVDADGRTLLMHAVLASNADTRMVKFLVDGGVPVGAKDDGQNWTALHFAARDKRSDLVEVLLQSGADVNAVDIFGNTALGRALDSLPTDRQTIHLLMRAGADPRHKNRYGSSPLDLARLTEDVELEQWLTES